MIIRPYNLFYELLDDPGKPITDIYAIKPSLIISSNINNTATSFSDGKEFEINIWMTSLQRFLARANISKQPARNQNLPTVLNNDGS